MFISSQTKLRGEGAKNFLDWWLAEIDRAISMQEQKKILSFNEKTELKHIKILRKYVKDMSDQAKETL